MAMPSGPLMMPGGQGGQGTQGLTMAHRPMGAQGPASASGPWGAAGKAPGGLGSLGGPLLEGPCQGMGKAQMPNAALGPMPPAGLPSGPLGGGEAPPVTYKSKPSSASGPFSSRPAFNDTLVTKDAARPPLPGFRAPPDGFRPAVQPPFPGGKAPGGLLPAGPLGGGLLPLPTLSGGPGGAAGAAPAGGSSPPAAGDSVAEVLRRGEEIMKRGGELLRSTPGAPDGSKAGGPGPLGMQAPPFKSMPGLPPKAFPEGRLPMPTEKKKQAADCA